jgi:hypothetical protein
VKEEMIPPRYTVMPNKLESTSQQVPPGVWRSWQKAGGKSEKQQQTIDQTVRISCGMGVNEQAVARKPSS